MEKIIQTTDKHNRSKLDDMMKIIKFGNIDNFLSTLSKQPSFDINTQNEYGNTLLHIACRSRKYEIAKVLLDKFNAKTDIKNADGRTPLHIATIYGSTDKACYIFQDKYAKKRITDSSNIVNMIVNKTPYVLHIKDNDGMTAMNYFNIYSEPSCSEQSSSAITSAKYKSYKRVAAFFDKLKESCFGDDDYELSMSIYFAMKKGQL